MHKSTQDTRSFFAAFSVRIGTRRINFELSHAEEYGGTAGMVRVRKERRWVNCPNGEPRFFDREALGAFIASTALASLEPAPPMPALRAKQRVSVHTDEDRLPLGGWTCTEPLLAYDGTWQIAVTTAEGTHFVDCAVVTPLKTGRKNDVCVKKGGCLV